LRKKLQNDKSFFRNQNDKSYITTFQVERVMPGHSVLGQACKIPVCKAKPKLTYGLKKPEPDPGKAEAQVTA
jgi:hypothetical protein